MDIHDSFSIGYISKTRGLKGELQVFFEEEDYQDLDLDVIFIDIDRRLVPFFVSSSKLHDNRTGYFFLEDVDHVDKAKALVRHTVYLPNSKKPVRDADDFRITDLKGYLVKDKNHGELGEIIEVHQYPQHDVAAISYKFRELLIPLNDSFIISINKEEGILETDLPEGLVELYSGED
ncbi:16S rRNA processing protein RimM [bacterium A37T11]|nr:16S rRNA processing protein RimM [bacterium A37T11]